MRCEARVEKKRCAGLTDRSYVFGESRWWLCAGCADRWAKQYNVRLASRRYETWHKAKVE